MGGRGDSVSLGLLEENERKGRGLPRFSFAGEGLSLVAGCRKGNGAAVMENERVRGSCSVKERGE
jgi:hypothetical protein